MQNIDLNEMSTRMNEKEIGKKMDEFAHNLYAAIDDVVADFLENMPVPLENLYFAISMGVIEDWQKSTYGEREYPILYWKTTTGQSVGNTEDRGYEFGEHMKKNLEPSCNDLYFQLLRGLMGKPSKTDNDDSGQEINQPSGS